MRTILSTWFTEVARFCQESVLESIQPVGEANIIIIIIKKHCVEFRVI